jgi:hypothetical protein
MTARIEERREQASMEDGRAYGGEERVSVDGGMEERRENYR